MSQQRHPAGTSVGGQWAPGSATEIETELLDAFDDTFDDPQPQPAPEPYDPPISGDGGFDFGLEPAEEMSSTTLSLDQARTAEPGELIKVTGDRGTTYVLGCQGGVVVYSGTAKQHQVISYVRQAPGEPETSHFWSVSGPPAVLTPAERDIDDDDLQERGAVFAGSGGYILASDTEAAEVDLSSRKKMRAYLESLAHPQLGSTRNESSMQWMQRTQIGCGRLNDVYDRVAAYDHMRQHPHLHPISEHPCDDDVELDDLADEHRDTAFAYDDTSYFYTSGGRVHSASF